MSTETTKIPYHAAVGNLTRLCFYVPGTIKIFYSKLPLLVPLITMPIAIAGVFYILIYAIKLKDKNQIKRSAWLAFFITIFAILFLYVFNLIGKWSY